MHDGNRPQFWAATKAQRTRQRTLVLGIGNVTRSDDGIGVHIVRELKKQPRVGVHIAELGTSILDALPLLAWADRVMAIDALVMGAAPGTIYSTQLDDIAPKREPLSIHDLDLASVLELLPAGCLRPPVHIVGIEPASLEFGVTLSPALTEQFATIVAVVDHALQSFRARTI